MSDEEYDYMSDKFLQNAEKVAPQSLVYRYAEKRAYELEKKRAPPPKRACIIEAEKREEGLSSAIANDNKGYGMLLKMGYKPGQGIGKSESGIAEPISIDLKANRFGLGKKTAIKQTMKTKNKNRVVEVNTDDFRNRMSQQKDEQLTEADLRKSQKVCQELDLQSNRVKPDILWFWPKIEKTEEDEDEDEEESEEDPDDDDNLTSSEKLTIITEYLKNEHCYCIWCGAKFDDLEDQIQNCPGNSRKDH